MNSPYLLLPLSVLSLILYLITLTLSRLEVIKLTAHRKIWNTLLLITFLVTALLGLILAVQVNYKLKIPYLKQILTWHVDFGIGMTMIAIFHFLWHWSYYTNIFKKRKHNIVPELSKQPYEQFPEISHAISKKSIIWSAILLGFTSILTQIVVVREFLIVFGGNELIIGIILANWMIITATGAYLGKLVRIKHVVPAFISVSFAILGALPLVIVFLTDFLKNIVFQPGVAFGVIKITGSSAFILLPFCLLSGFLFTYIATMYSAVHRMKKIDKIYAFESVGSIFGALIFSYLLAVTLSTFQVLALLFFVNVIGSMFFTRMKPAPRLTFAITAIAVSMLPFLINVDKLVKQFLFPHQEILYLKDTPFGNLTVTNYGDQRNFFENNMLLFTTDNNIASEEATHYAMIQHDSPNFVLLISGGISGITDEILKYGVTRIDYIELNSWIFKLGHDYTFALDNPRIRMITDDARLYIKKADKKYDVVLINLPDPVTAQINRYYTIDFYRELKKILNPGGIVSFGLSSTANYISGKAAELNSTILKTVKNVFNYAIIFPGEKNYFILSDEPLQYSITGLFGQKSIENSYVNKYYLDDELIKQRAEYIISTLNPDVKINRDFSPVAYFNQINLWLSKYKAGNTILYFIAAAFAFIFIFILYKVHPAKIGMLTAGFTASAMEILLIIVFQVIYGYIYLVMGAFFAVFMSGLALGTWYREKIKPQPQTTFLIYLQLIMIGLLIFSIPCIFLLKYLSVFKVLVFIICFGLLFAIAFLVGIFFSAATLVLPGNSKSVSAGVYFIDLLGSAAGAFFTSSLLIPLFGLYATLVFTILLSFITLFVIHLKNKRNLA